MTRPACPSCKQETRYERRIKLSAADPEEVFARRRWKCPECAVRVDTFEAIQNWRFPTLRQRDRLLRARAGRP